MAIQVLPSGGDNHPYNIVDEAIEVIKKAGVKYKVCPFETVVEASYEKAMEIAEKVQDACYNAGSENLMCYIKIQSAKDSDIKIESKMNKYM